jgi:hypothetical protein
VRSDKNVKTFQRERPTRQRREEESDAALNSANAHIGRIPLICNAACLMKGLRGTHGFAIQLSSFDALWKLVDSQGVRPHSIEPGSVASADVQKVQRWALEMRKSRKAWTRATERISSA